LGDEIHDYDAAARDELAQAVIDERPPRKPRRSSGGHGNGLVPCSDDCFCAHGFLSCKIEPSQKIPSVVAPIAIGALSRAAPVLLSRRAVRAAGTVKASGHVITIIFRLRLF